MKTGFDAPGMACEPSAMTALGWFIPSPFRRLAALALFAAAGFALPFRVAAAATPAAATAFVAKFCGDCHGKDDPEGDVRLDALAAAPAKPDDLAAWKHVYEQLESRRMPPADAEQPALAERLAAMDWIRTTLAAAGAPVDESRARASSRGNWVDHEFLFAGKAQGDTATPGRVWRITDDAYTAWLNRMGKGYGKELTDLVPPWQIQAKWSFPDYSTAHRIGDAEVEIHMRSCQRLAKKLLHDGAIMGGDGKPLYKALKTKPFAPLAAVLKDGGKATPEQVSAAVQAAFELLLGREPDADEASRYGTFLKASLEGDAAEAAVERFLTVVLCHPSVLYRIERPADGKPRGLPPPGDLARSISFTLTDREPDPALAKAVAEGKLATAAEVRGQVERILADDAIPKPRVVRFFRDYFAYDTAPDVFKDETTQKANGVSEWFPTFFVTDADRLVGWVLARDKDVLKELLTTNKTFALTYDPRKNLREAYYQNTRFGGKGTPPEAPFKRGTGVHGVMAVYELDFKTRGDWSPDVPYEMPAEHRMGMLTHPAWLVAQSGNFDNHAIHRGRWIRERLLGGAIPDVPITVNAMLPDEPHRTLRDRMNATREAYCWTCHRTMDPLGLPFEQFDHFGRFRTEEQVVDKEATEALQAQMLAAAKRKGRELRPEEAARIVYKKLPLDTVGVVEGSLDPALNGPVKDPFELIRKLADSKLVEQVFVRHAFRFFMGRNETYADGPVLVAAHEAYAKNGGSMRALIASLLTSDAFLYRTSPAPSSPARRQTAAAK